MTILNSWRHGCELEAGTLALLLRHHRPRGLHVARYAEPQAVSGLVVEGLRRLILTDVNVEKRCEWPYQLIVRNRNSLRELHLGAMAYGAYHYAVSCRSARQGLTFTRKKGKEAVFGSQGQMVRLPSLESLGLCGLDVGTVVAGALGLEIDFAGLTALRLESCSGLNGVLADIVGRDTQRATPLRLTSFVLRHERANEAFTQHLTAFLTSFAGLRHLVLLVEGHPRAMCKAPILETHGKTLQTLVWDERKGPRLDTRSDTALVPNDNSLHGISQHCPNLTALGLSIKWGRFPRSTTIHPLVSIYASEYPCASHVEADRQ